MSADNPIDSTSAAKSHHERKQVVEPARSTDIEKMSVEDLRVMVHELRIEQRELRQALAEKTTEFILRGQDMALLSRAIADLTEGVLITRNHSQWENSSIVFASEAMCRITAYNTKELIGASPRILHGKQTNGETLDQLQRELSRGRSFSCELVNYRKDGTPYTVDLLVSLLPSSSELQSHTVAVYRDLTEQKQVEATLRREHELNESIIDTAQQIILLLDSEGRVIRFNRYMEELTGWRLEDVCGRDWFETFLPEQDRLPTRQLFQQAIGGTRTRGHVNPIVTRDGREIAIEWYDAPLTCVEGELIGLVCTGQDVTERLRSEQTRRDLAAIVASSDDAIFSKDLEGIIQSWNSAAERMYGYSEDEMVGQSIAILVPPDKRKELDTILGRIRQKESVNRLETVRLRQGGLRFDVSLTVSPITDATGRVIGASTIARDITERKQIESSLRQSEERLRAILNTAADSVITIDEHGIIIDANPATAAMFGYRLNELLGQNVKLLMPPPYCEEHDDYIERFLKTGEAKIIGVGREVEGLHKDGTVFPIDLAVSQVDHLGLFTGIIRDITERKAAQQRLIQSERLAALGEAMAGLTHESRNALARSLGNLRRLQRRLQGEDELLQLIDGAWRASDDIRRQFDEVRDYAAPIHLSRERVNLAEIIQQTWDDLATERQGREAELQLDGGALDLTCQADPFLLRNVFRNLFENALAAAPDLVGIDIQFRDAMMESTPAIEVSVHDHGPGMPPDVQQRAFDAFFTTRTRGTGLGLAIVKRSVEAHGGAVAFGPDGQHGTEVVVTLPRSQLS